jgi:UDP-N-acetylglucosamine 2-epimerase
MMAYLHQLKFAHIEAGLRTFDLENPFPEEYFRRIISLSADVHFAPTELAKQNLLAERIQKEKIILTGNTIVDAIEMYKNMDYTLENEHLKPLINKANHVLISCHRRENQNDNFDSLMLTVQELAGANPRLSFIWLSHLNPFVSSRIKNKALNSIPNIHVIEPISFLEMIGLYKECKLIITDSGGIQEEAVTFGIPTIVIR